MNIEKRFSLAKTSKVFNRILKNFNLKNKEVLDLGCGYGEYLVNFDKNSLGVTTTQSEIKYGKDNNLNIIYGNVELIDQIVFTKKFEIIWANNFFEHILSPHSFLVKLKTISERNTDLILGVPVIPKIEFLLKIKKFRGSLASNHINFFTKKSLELTVERAGWKIKEIRSFVFDNKFLDKVFTLFFSPHIYVIAKNDTGFKYPSKKIEEWGSDSYYKKILDINR